MEERINAIIERCNKLTAEEKISIIEFGRNKDLTLYIAKDCDYLPTIDVYNMVQISTKQDGKWVDDTEDIYVTDGSLYAELKRIWNYESFKTL